MTDQELVEQAFTMLERSYVPYSHFPCLLYTSDAADE